MKQWLAAVMFFGAFAANAATDCAKPADGERPQHRVHWSTRSEIQSAGFDVFRAERADGDYVKLNDKPIPSATNSVRTREYEYVDYAIDPCKVYFYYVEAIGEKGNRMKLTEPQQAGPKSAAPAK